MLCTHVVHASLHGQAGPGFMFFVEGDLDQDEDRYLKDKHSVQSVS